MLIGVLRETCPNETRVAVTPATAKSFKKMGIDVIVEAGAGARAGYTDADYAAVGVDTVGRRAVFERATLLPVVRQLGANPVAGQADLQHLCAAHTVVGFSEPLSEPGAAAQLAQTGACAFSVELIPRISRAQGMDALSSMASVAGYKAMLVAAAESPRMFPMMMTAAGTVKPARVLVLGAGVAGLQAIATARRLGAVIQAFDVRPEVKEQVESLGAKFVSLDLETQEGEGGYAKAQGADFQERQQALMFDVVTQSEVVITTAAIPGRQSPILVTEAMVKAMPTGSVIVDLAAERGGNCDLTNADRRSLKHGVTILGPTNLPSTVPFHASQLYSKNVENFVKHLLKDGQLSIDTEDEITAASLVSRNGEVVHPKIIDLLADGAGYPDTKGVSV